MSVESEQSDAAQRLTCARRASGISTRVLAEKVGVAYSTVRAHESRQNGIRPAAAGAYAGALGVTPEYLLFGTPPVTDSVVDDTRGEGCSSPSRPTGPEKGANPSPTVFIEFSGHLPVRIAAKVLALLEEGQR